MSTLRNILNTGTAIYIEFIIGFIVSIIIARSLGPDQYGIYAFYIWVSSLLITLAKNGISTGVIKFLAETEHKQDRATTNNIYSYFLKMEVKVLIVIFICFGSIAIFYWTSIFEFIEFFLIIPLLIAVYSKSLYMFLVSTSKGISRFDLLSKTVIIVGPLNLIIVLYLYYIEASLHAFLYTFTITSVLYYIVLRRQSKSIIEYNNRPTIDPETRIRIKRHVLLVSFNILLGFIIFRQSEVAFLNYFGSKEDVAFYNIGFMLASGIMELIPGAYVMILLPMVAGIYASNKDNLPNTVKNSIRYLFMLTVPAVVFGIYFSSEIIHLVYGKDYSQAVKPFIFSLISAGIIVLAQSSISYLVSADRQRDLLKLLIITACINLILDYYLIKHYMLDGAIAANLIANCFYSIIVLSLTIRKLKAKLNYGALIRLFCISLFCIIPSAIFSNIGMADNINLGLSFIVFTSLYFVLTVRMYCWSDEELKKIQTLLEKKLAHRNIILKLISSSISNKRTINTEH